VAALSLVLAEYDVRTDPPAAFYLPLPRAWELMVGSLLALPDFPFPRQRILREVVAAAGLGLILFAVYGYDASTPFPGLTALAPVVGAALILWGCDRGVTFTGALLSVPPLRFIGLWSYSIYMLHWPLFVFFGSIDRIRTFG
jgi:peptidoglycan/LPS O-acetylase OafA/YrhL